MSFQSIGALLPEGPVSVDLGEVEKLCETHGPYQSRGMRFTLNGRERWSRCPTCQAEAAERERLETEEREAKARQDQLAEMLGQTAIPGRFIGKSFDTYVAATPEQEKAVRIARYYAEHFDDLKAQGKGMIMSGGMGTGKSHLAVAVLQSILPRHVGVYTTFMGMMGMIRNTYDHESKVSERSVIQRLSSVPLLVLDEVGVQRGTEDEHLQLFGIIDTRYSAGLPTIVLTNLDEDNLKRFIGDRIFDRLREVCKWVSFNWPSYRKPSR